MVIWYLFDFPYFLRLYLLILLIVMDLFHFPFLLLRNSLSSSFHIVNLFHFPFPLERNLFLLLLLFVVMAIGDLLHLPLSSQVRDLLFLLFSLFLCRNGGVGHLLHLPLSLLLLSSVLTLLPWASLRDLLHLPLIHYWDAIIVRNLFNLPSFCWLRYLLLLILLITVMLYF